MVWDPERSGISPPADAALPGAGDGDSPASASAPG
jgi:hypothetical protein